MEHEGWIEIPAGRYGIGLTLSEARELAARTAAEAARIGAPAPFSKWLEPDHEEWARTWANTSFVEERLLERYPAREVHIEEFAIARAPVTHGELVAFVKERDERDEGWPPPYLSDAAPDSAAMDVPWWLAIEFAESRGARLPFEDEWERAVRDSERRVVLEHTPLVLAGREWCADIWIPEEGLAHGSRVLRGGAGHDEVLGSAVSRAPGDPFAELSRGTTFRLARGDGRVVPAHPASSPPEYLATDAIRSFECRVVVPALARVEAQVSWSGRYEADEADDLVRAARKAGVGDTYAQWPPRSWTRGRFALVGSGKDLRLWAMLYCLAGDGAVRTRAFVIGRSASGKLEAVRRSLRAGKDELSLSEIDEPLVVASLGEPLPVPAPQPEKPAPLATKPAPRVPQRPSTPAGGWPIVITPVEGWQRESRHLWGAAFSPDGSRLVTTDLDGRVTLYEKRREGLVAAASVDTSRVGGETRYVVWSPDGTHVITRAHEGIALRRASDLAAVVHAKPENAEALAFGGSGTWVAACDNRFDILSIPDFELRARLDLQKNRMQNFTIRDVAADPFGSVVIAVDDGGSDERSWGEWSGTPALTFYDVASATVIARAEHVPVSEVAFDPWRRVFVVASYQDITTWSMKGELLRRFRPEIDEPISSLQVTERWIATLTYPAFGRKPPQRIELWDPSSFERLGYLEVPGGELRSWLRASPDGSLLLTEAPGLLFRIGQ